MNGFQSQGQAFPHTHTIKQETSALAIVSLVCGIAGWLGFNVIGTFIIGIVCGHLALSRIKKSNGVIGGRGIAIIGLALNYAFVVMALLLILIFVSFFILGSVSR